MATYRQVWGHQLYSLYGILSLVFLILIIVTSFITIALTYFQVTALRLDSLEFTFLSRTRLSQMTSHLLHHHRPHLLPGLTSSKVDLPVFWCNPVNFWHGSDQSTGVRDPLIVTSFITIALTYFQVLLNLTSSKVDLPVFWYNPVNFWKRSVKRCTEAISQGGYGIHSLVFMILIIVTYFITIALTSERESFIDNLLV